MTYAYQPIVIVLRKEPPPRPPPFTCVVCERLAEAPVWARSGDEHRPPVCRSCASDGAHAHGFRLLVPLASADRDAYARCVAVMQRLMWEVRNGRYA